MLRERKSGHLNPLHVEGLVYDPSVDSPFLARKPNKSLREEQPSQGVHPDLLKGPRSVHKDFLNHVRVRYCQPRL